MKKYAISRIFKIVVLPALLGLSLFVSGYYFVLYAVWDYDSNFLEADTCLNLGGVWDKENERCFFAGQCEDEGGFWSAAESRCINK